MMAMPHAFIHGKAYTQQYGCASTALALPEQSAHHDSVPVLAKGLAKPIIILLEPGGGGWRKKNPREIVFAVRFSRGGGQNT